jgi:hypothetical protein
VEVNPPFVVGLGAVRSVQCFRQIEAVIEVVAAPNHDLVEIDVVGERAECGHRALDGRFHPETGRELHLENPDSRTLDEIDALDGVLELDSRVAGIEANSEMAAERSLRFAAVSADRTRMSLDRCARE